MTCLLVPPKGYPNYVTSLIGDDLTYRRCYKYAKSSASVFACAAGEVRARGSAILSQIVSELHERYYLVGLTERMKESLALLQCAISKSNFSFPGSMCLSQLQAEHKNKHEHQKKETPTNIHPFLELDVQLYNATAALFEKQLVAAREMGCLV